MIARLCDRCGAPAFVNHTPCGQPVSDSRSVTIRQDAPATNQTAVTADFGTTLEVVLAGNDFCVPCAISALKAYLAAIGG